MGKIQISTKQIIKVKESTEQIFELLKHNKQFIFLEQENTTDIGGEFEYKPKVDYLKIAISKAHIVQVF